MIKKFIYGNPINTQATVLDIASENGEICYLQKQEMNGIFTFTYTMGNDDIVYGLGESIRGINKRGWFYENYCSDDPVHTEGKNSLYGAHNFIMIYGKETFGLFFDCSGKIKFDIGFDTENQIKITVNELNFNIFVIDGNSPTAIVKEFRKLIGKSYIAPYWAFGYQQSRWGYCNNKDITEVYDNYKKCGIPLDAIYMDIDYMKDYKDFTIDEEKFPNFEEFAKDYKSKGVRLVPIIDAGVKIEDGYDVCEEGIKNGYFCKDKDGKDFVTAVWPGYTYFPDFLNSETRKWFGMKYKKLTDMGIEGFWNDMNEPAIFYSEKGLKKAWDTLKQYEGQKLNIDNFFEVRDVFAKLSNNQEDYNSFYHNMDGTIICHNKVHNLYGFNMTRAASDALTEIRKDKRTLLFSRASCIGMHRYGGIWTGDNQSWWSHLAQSIKQMPSLNMCGFLYTGSDIGGFGSNTSRDLLLRWLAFGIFTPLMRNHSAIGTREQECYKFQNTEDFKSIIELRYRLIPYLYSEYMKAALKDEMYFRPIAFDYANDKRALRIEDQLMVGNSIMITPVYEQNMKGRYVYLPEDMMYVTFVNGNIFTKIMKKGDHFINVDLNEIPLFIKKNRFIPLCNSASCTDKLDKNTLEILGYVTNSATYEMYEDDGYTTNYSLDSLITITVNAQQNKFDVKCSDCKKNITLNIVGE